MSVAIDPPDHVRRAHSLPLGSLVVVSDYGTGDPAMIGLWFAKAGEERQGQRWPVVVEKAKAQQWIDQAQEDDWPCHAGDDGYPEHDYETEGEVDGVTIHLCRRCGAETIESDDD